MKVRKKKYWTRKTLIAWGVPAILIPGILASIALGWNPKVLLQLRNYYTNTHVFPESGVAKKVVDGDTFTLQNGTQVRLLGIDAPGRGQGKYDQATEYLETIIQNKTVYLEYDRYQDDKYGRVLAWIWVDCEKTPTFLPANYMHLTYNSSRPGLTDNPEGCKEGALANEKMVLSGLATAERYRERGELKYEKRLGVR